MTQRIFVISVCYECFESCCDEQEAADTIAKLIDEEDASEDDIWVIRGEELTLHATKPASVSVSLNGKKFL